VSGLVVEDELVIALDLENLLSQLGCIPLNSAPTIQKALRALSDERPDVVVLDVDLRGERVTRVTIALNEQRAVHAWGRRARGNGRVVANFVTRARAKSGCGSESAKPPEVTEPIQQNEVDAAA
jgi:CheY-like chemotaxis protein